MKRGILWAVLLSLIGIGGVWSVSAATFNSSNFSINGNVGDSAAGGQTSTNYRLTSAAGESIVGQSGSGSYKLGQGYISTLEQSLQVNVQPTSQVAYYPLDENTGTAVWDATTNNNHGTATNSPSWATGKVGSALSFDGSNDYVVVNDNASFATGSSPVTMSSWVNFNAGGLGVFQGIMSQWLDSFEINKSDTNKLRIEMKCSDNSVRRAEETTASLTSSGTWYHVAATFNPTNGAVSLYVNGASRAVTYVDAQAACAGGLKNSSLGVYVGAREPGGVHLNGLLDEVKLYSRSLSASEIDAEYDAGSAGNISGLSLNAVTPGASQTASFDSIVQTDSPGYVLAINQNNNLTSGGNTISPVSGSIASPVSWSEGSTKGLGFTLYGTNATAIPGTWASGGSYAALPGSSTTFYTRTGFNGGAKDYVNMRLRLDVNASQVAGNYTNQMTITGTMTP